MMFIKLTYDALERPTFLMRVDKIRYVIGTDHGATIWLDDDVNLDVVENVDVIFAKIWQMMADMAEAGML